MKPQERKLAALARRKQRREAFGQWSRKTTVAARYDTSERSIDRMWRGGRLPAPEFPLGPHLPLWRNAALDEHDQCGACTPSAA
jgi:hypothetical protein